MEIGELDRAIMEMGCVVGTEEVLACIVLIKELSEVEVRVIDDPVPVLVLPVFPP